MKNKIENIFLGLMAVLAIAAVSIKTRRSNVKIVGE